MPLQRSPAGTLYSSQPNLRAEDECEFLENINIRKRKHPDQENFLEFCEEMRNMLSKFQQSQEFKLDSLNKAIEDLTINNTKLIASNNEIEKMLNENKNRQEKLKERIQVLEGECVNAHKRIESLEDQVNDLQKNSLKKYLEIRNIPKLENENLKEIVTNVLKIVDIKINNDDIKYVYRNGKENAPISVKVKDFQQKINILKAVKSYNSKNKENKINCDKLGMGMPSQPIYVSEKLTVKTKHLLALSKQLVTNNLYKYCWISKGKVMLRKESALPSIIINSIKDIEVLKNSNQQQ